MHVRKQNNSVFSMDLMYVRVPVEEFNKALWNRYHNGKIRNVYPLIKYNDIIEKIKAMVENPPCNTPGEYYLLRKFIVVKINGKERLSCKPESNSENTQEQGNPTKFYVALEEIYGYLDDAHKFIKHGCRDRLVRRMQSQGIVNITRDTVELFLSFCKLCRPRKSQVTRRVGSKTVPTSNLPPEEESVNNNITSESAPNTQSYVRNSSDADNVKNQTRNQQPRTVCTFTRGFIDLLDYSSTPDGDYRYVFLYLDIQTCFCVLYPIRCKCTTEMVSHLLNTFTLLGPPQVLHSNFENQFLQTLIHDLKQSLPELVLVSGSKNYAELQAVAQNCVSEISSMLKLWMYETSSNHWSLGLKLIQLRKNTKLPSSSTKSPYECFFGHSLNSNLPPMADVSTLKRAEKEEQLLSLINEHSSSEPYEHLQVSVDPDICTLVQNQHNTSPFETISSDIIPANSIVKSEPVSDSDTPETNGFELSDSSNDVCTSPNDGNLEIVIKEELGEES